MKSYEFAGLTLGGYLGYFINLTDPNHYNIFKI